jgi:hypothetical protein
MRKCKDKNYSNNDKTKKRGLDKNKENPRSNKTRKVGSVKNKFITYSLLQN